MAMKKSAPKKVVAKKGDEPVRVGSKVAPKKARVLTKAESISMGKAMGNSYRVEYRGKGWVKDKGSNTYSLKGPSQSGFGASKPMVDFNKKGPFAASPEFGRNFPGKKKPTKK